MMRQPKKRASSVSCSMYSKAKKTTRTHIRDASPENSAPIPSSLKHSSMPGPMFHRGRRISMQFRMASHEQTASPRDRTAAAARILVRPGFHIQRAAPEITGNSTGASIHISLMSYVLSFSNGSPAAGVTQNWQALSLSSVPQGRSMFQSAHFRP